MSDTARHDAPQPDIVEARHTLTVREVEAQLARAGVQRSHRHVLRLCQSGMLDAVKIPGGPSGEEWYVTPESVPKAIGDLKQIDAQRARRSPPQPAVSGAKTQDDSGATEPATARHGATDLDIYDHPYVKRLEDRVEKLEAKYEAQVRRTEDIQTKSQEQLIELQRMTAVSNSTTLADFMLKARNWVLGSSAETSEREVDNTANPT